MEKKIKKTENKNAFLITCVACVVLLLLLCYLGINSSSTLKGTSAVDTEYTCTCDEGIPHSNGDGTGYCELKTQLGNLKEDYGWSCELTSGSVAMGTQTYTCTKDATCNVVSASSSSSSSSSSSNYACYCFATGGTETCEWMTFDEAKNQGLNNASDDSKCDPESKVPSDSTYVCFAGPAEGYWWAPYGDYKDNSLYDYLPGVARADCADGGNACGVDSGYGTWTETSCKSAGYTWSSSFECCDTSSKKEVCYEAPNGEYLWLKYDPEYETRDNYKIRSEFDSYEECAAQNPKEDVPSDSTYVCFDGPAEGRYWAPYGDHKNDKNYNYLPGVSHEECDDDDETACYCFATGGTETCEWLTFDDAENQGLDTPSDDSKCSASTTKNACYSCERDNQGIFDYFWGDYSGSANCSKTAYNESQCSVVDSGGTVKVIVKYDANSGSGTMADTTCTFGVPCVTTKNAFTRSCYKFNGWTGSDGKSYSDGASVTIRSDLTLTAKWTYTCGGGTSDPTPPSSSSSSSSYNPPSSNPDVPSNDPSSENVGDNPQTGEITIFIVLIIALAAIVYSVWYFKKIREN